MRGLVLKIVASRQWKCCASWDNKLNNKFERPNRTLPLCRCLGCSNSKSCYFLFGFYCSDMQIFSASSSPFAFSLLVCESLSKSKTNFSFALLRSKQDNNNNEMEKKTQKKNKQKAEREQRKRLRNIYKLKCYENNGVIYCMWELISVTGEIKMGLSRRVLWVCIAQ